MFVLLLKSLPTSIKAGVISTPTTLHLNLSAKNLAGPANPHPTYDYEKKEFKK